MKANGIELKEIKSKAEVVTINNLDDALSCFNSNGYVVAYLDYKVLIGGISNNRFEFYGSETIEEKYIQRLRLFNDQKELLIWHGNSTLNGRLRIDDEGDDTFVVEAYQVLWGTDKKDLGNGWSRLYEERGTELILPVGNVEINNKKKRLFLKTRNYITFHPKTYRATYGDCRFVELMEKPF